MKPFFKSKKQYHKRLDEGVEELSELQRLHYASDRYAILLIFQAMDAAGKDGAIPHVMSGVNPQGCQVFGFKQPSAEDLEHDFLWRTTRCLPERGRIGIFNRSYYEEVLIVRVHPEILRAVDNALWDLKAKLFSVPLVSLLGATREALPIYGSGGFTNYSIAKQQKQLGGWVRSGIARVKMKIGLDAKADRERVAGAREAIGPDADLFVDANGAYSRKQALAQAEAFAELNVTWFEEPVTSDDLEGLRLLRDRPPAGIDITAGEYGYDLTYFERMLSAGAVDVLQADATRCCGITGFLQAAALCDAHHVPLSSHCAPALHVHPGCAVGSMRHAEYFYDHVRIENMLFEGTPQPRDGALRPDLSRAGNGLELTRADAERYRILL